VTRICKSALVPYSAHEIYVLVADVETYSEFLPWCADARIVKREQDAVVAAIDVAYSGVHKTFTTRNSMLEDQRIEMRLLDGPFSRLDGRWEFQALEVTSSKISFDLEFQFSNLLLGLAMGTGFSRIADSMVDSFLKRAVQIYGPR